MMRPRRRVPRPPSRALVLLARVAVLTLVAWAAPGCTRSPRPELNLFSWSEYVPDSVIDGFVEETGIRVNQETFSSNEEMLSKLLSGATHYDVIQPSEYTAEALVRAGRVRRIDWSRVPNIGRIAPEFLHLPHDPGQEYTVPWMAGTVGIVVDTRKIPAGSVRGYRDVFRPEHRGRIVVVNDPREMVSWALSVANLPLNEVTPENLERVRPILREWIPMVRVFDSDSPKNAFLGGDVDIGIVWSGEAAELWRRDRRFEFVLPEEGAHRFVDNLAIPVDAPNPDAAHAFLDYVLRPEVSAKVSAEFPYTNPNLDARKLIDEHDLANPASYPPPGRPLDTFRDIGQAAVAIDQMVAELKSGR